MYSRLACLNLRMSKRTHEAFPGKRKKAIAKADAVRAVIDKTKPITQLFSVPEASAPEVATDLECLCQFQQDPVFFCRTFVRSRTFVKNRTWSHFSFSGAGVCVVFIYSNPRLIWIRFDRRFYPV